MAEAAGETQFRMDGGMDIKMASLFKPATETLLRNRTSGIRSLLGSFGFGTSTLGSG